MKLKDLYLAIKQLGPQQYYHINTNNDTTYILDYDRKRKVWEYYFLDERGGKGEVKIFVSEEEACEYAYKDAIETISTFKSAYAQAENESE